MNVPLITNVPQRFKRPKKIIRATLIEDSQNKTWFFRWRCRREEDENAGRVENNQCYYIPDWTETFPFTEKSGIQLNIPDQTPLENFFLSIGNGPD